MPRPSRRSLFTLSFYDVLDQPRTIYLPSGESVAIAYDQEGANTLTAGGTTLIDAVGYNERGQLALLSRANGAPDTTRLYHGATGNFRLNKILHGGEGGTLPDFIYGATQYDPAGNLLGMQMKVNAATESYAFGYDALNRLTTAELSGAGTANYNYTYNYSELGNIKSRTGTLPNLTYTYNDQAAVPDSLPKVEGGPQAVTRVSLSSGAVWSYTYDPRGNLDDRFTGLIRTHDYTFDVEGRLASGRTNNVTTTFFYDADGNRVLSIYNSGTAQETKVYTPFPDYEMEDPPSGADVTRTTYRIAGQIVAVQKRVGTAAGTFSYTYTDHLGNIVALSSKAGVLDAASLARYDPFGNFRTTPTTNPGVSDRGFTGHRHNNTGANNLGLIYMNARYYLPEVGRFVSPNTVVPDPNNPQGYNRYSYVLNSPVNFADPTGHKHCSGIGTSNECEPQFQRPSPINDNGSGSNPLVGWLKDATREIFHFIALKEPRVQPVPYSTDPYLADLTEWLVAQMVSTAQSPLVLLLHALWTLPDQGAGTQKLIVLQLWTELVATGGVWDFKVDIQREKTFSADKQLKQLVQLGNHVMSYQAVANIFYGFIGMQIGLDPVLLQMGAGAAQMEQGYGHWQANIDAYPAGFGDQPFDAWAIGFGFALHVQFGQDVSALTVSTFTTALDTYSASNPPLWEP